MFKYLHEGDPKHAGKFLFIPPLLEKKGVFGLNLVLTVGVGGGMHWGRVGAGVVG